MVRPRTVIQNAIDNVLAIRNTDDIIAKSKPEQIPHLRCRKSGHPLERNPQHLRLSPFLRDPPTAQVRSKRRSRRIHHHELVDKRILAYHGTHDRHIDPAQFANRKIVAPDGLELSRAALLFHGLFMRIAVTARHGHDAKQNPTNTQKHENEMHDKGDQGHKIKPPPLERATKWAYFIDF